MQVKKENKSISKDSVLSNEALQARFVAYLSTGDSKSFTLDDLLISLLQLVHDIKFSENVTPDSHNIKKPLKSKNKDHPHPHNN